MKQSSNDSPSKSLSKTMKKSSKSRSKILKLPSGSNNNHNSTNSQAPMTPTPSTSSANQHEAPTTPTSDSKSHHRSHAGFGPKTIKVIWEQHDTSDTEIVPEVYARLAEDVSYKVWELANNLKTYARHLTGRVTCDVVNDVLKDSDVPPILGAGDTDWDRIEYDGSFFFNTDRIVELREEYLKEIEEETPLPTSEVSRCWVMDRKHAPVLVEFITNITNAACLGDEEAFEMAIESAATEQHMGTCLISILKICIDLLAFEQTVEVSERLLRFLQALAFNPCSRDTDCQEQLFHLAEILVCQLMDTFESIRCRPKLEKKEESFELVKNYLENSDVEIKKDGETTLDQMDVDDIRSEYEALFQMMERDGFREREEPMEDGEDMKPTVDELAAINKAAGHTTVDIQEEEVKQEVKNEEGDDNVVQIEPPPPHEVPEVKKIFILEKDSGDMIEVKYPIKTDFSPYHAQMMPFDKVENVCNTIQQFSETFGYFRTECIFLIRRRFEKFFESRPYVQERDFEYIIRGIRGLALLGEYAFKEFIPYMERIDTETVPEWIWNDFAVGAMYLKGRDDIFLYEWLEDLCGDKLQPFMTFHYRFHQKLITHRCEQLRKATYKIYPKVMLKTIERRKNGNTNQIHDYFPELATLSTTAKKIEFKFRGCRPIIVKSKVLAIGAADASIVQTCRESINRNVAIGQRKLLKPLVNEKKFPKLSNFCFTSL